MDYDFDPAKDEANVEARGLRLGDCAGFDAEPTLVEDERVDYGEARFRACGRIGGKGYCLVYTEREVPRLISFRRAHEKEMRRYA
ncbi:MAG: uncharacterized protein QOD42_155 [Sphingomonadales bacterium]|jgi:uncharacterized DUF497 family protein|nr:uncharacterized protein [Sphingomonadales bacterium]